MKTLLRFSGLLLIGLVTAFVIERLVGNIAAVAIPRDVSVKIQTVPGLSQLLYTGLMSLAPAALVGALAGLLAYPLLRGVSNWLLLAFALGTVLYTHGVSVLFHPSPHHGLAQQFAQLAEPSILTFYAAPVLAAVITTMLLRRRDSFATKHAV